ncbi:MAG: histidine phosphatase family protein [Lachnospiraceae bacterium]|nr:histidine phosphatase family protein [Lachnospiraceae bacterium]
MLMAIYLARHGETDWNLKGLIQGHTDIPLNETGKQQAYELAAAIKDKGISINRIYSSDMKRARETAEIVAKELLVEAQALKGIQEVNLGRWEGHTWKQVRELFPDEYRVWYENRRYEVPPEGESYEQVLQRVVPVLSGIALKEDENVLVVVHSAVIMSLLSYVYDKPFEEMSRNFRTKNGEITELEKSMIKPL